MAHQILVASETWQEEDSDLILNWNYGELHIPHPAKSPYLHGQGTRLLVFRDGVIVGSLELIWPGPLPFPMASVYSRELKGLKIIGEVSRLSTNHLTGPERNDLLTETFTRMAAADGDVAIAGVNPKSTGVYCSFVGASIAGMPRTLADGLTPVILLTFTRQGFRGSVLGRRLGPPSRTTASAS